MSEQINKLECWFSGHVQGVGFRYKTVQIAKGYEVTGRVENLADGRVHLIAEGSAGEVAAFCEEVATQLEPFIREVEQEAAEGLRSFSGFTIEG